MPELILVKRDAHITTVVLNRPDKLNALTKAMWWQLGETFGSLSKDDSVRCIVLRGAGEKAFSPGNDIGEFETERSNIEQARDYGAIMTHTLEAISNCRHPIVALIRGICVGGGLEIASVCDIRICGESSRFGIPIKRLGLVMSLPELKGLVGLVGHATALEILLEGRVFDAREALQKRLVTRVVPDGELENEVHATADRIAEGAPLVARWHKQFVRRLAENPAPFTPDEIEEGIACYGTEDFEIGYRSFLSKTKPDFKGR